MEETRDIKFVLANVVSKLWSVNRNNQTKNKTFTNNIFINKEKPKCYNNEKLASRAICVAWVGMKTVRIFSDRIRDRIRLEGFKSVRIRVRIFNIRYRIRI